MNGAGLIGNMIKASTEAFMCVFEESWGLCFFMLSAAAPSHQEAGTTLRAAAQDGSSPVQHTGVR